MDNKPLIKPLFLMSALMCAAFLPRQYALAGCGSVDDPVGLPDDFEFLAIPVLLAGLGIPA